MADISQEVREEAARHVENMTGDIVGRRSAGTDAIQQLRCDQPSDLTDVALPSPVAAMSNLSGVV